MYKKKDPAKALPGSDKVFLALSFFSITAFLIVETASEDVWWHIAIGQDIIRNLAAPTIEKYTAASLGRPYQDSQWLFQAIAASAYNIAGITGTQIFTTLLWLATFVFTFLSAKKYTGHKVASILVFITAMASSERFIPRPEAVSYFMVAAYYYFLVSSNKLSTRKVIFLVILQIIWTNSHSLFIIGPFIVGCCWIEALGNHLQGKASGIKKMSLLLLSVILATLVTPYGINGWSFAYLLFTQISSSAPHVLTTIGEFRPTFDEITRDLPPFWFFFLLLILCAITSLLSARKSLPIGKILIAGGMLYAATTGRRNMVLFALTSAPLIAQNFSLLLPAGFNFRKSAPTLAILIFLYGLWPLSGHYYVHFGGPVRFGFGASPSFFPNNLPAFIKTIGFKSQVFNSHEMGGFYLFHRFPESIPLIDTRTGVIDIEELTKIMTAPQNPTILYEVLDKYNIKGFFLHHSSSEARLLLPRLSRDPGWFLAYFDHAASFWLRADLAYMSPKIDLDSARTTLPKVKRFEDVHLLDNFLRLMEKDRLRLANLQRGLSFRLKTVRDEDLLWEIGSLQLRLNLQKEAEETYKKLIRIDHDNIPALTQLAVFAFSRNDLAGAEKLLHQALKASPDNKAVKENYNKVKAARQAESKRKPATTRP